MHSLINKWCAWGEWQIDFVWAHWFYYYSLFFNETIKGTHKLAKMTNNQYLKKANRDITGCIVFDAGCIVFDAGVTGVTGVKYFLLNIEGFNSTI